MVHDVETVRKFYEGSGRDEPIPWEVWRSIIGMWMPFICALFLMMISFMAILRKQWIEHERLIYPLMQVPLAMTEEGEDDQKLSPFFKNPVMWAGFAIPALWGTLHGLYNYFPEIIPIAQNVDPIRMDVPVFRRTADLYVALRFNIIGFFYFLKTDIAFSLWFFNLLSFAVRGIFGILGVVSSETGGAWPRSTRSLFGLPVDGPRFSCSFWAASGRRAIICKACGARLAKATRALTTATKSSPIAQP